MARISLQQPRGVRLIGRFLGDSTFFDRSVPAHLLPTAPTQPTSPMDIALSAGHRPPSLAHRTDGPPDDHSMPKYALHPMPSSAPASNAQNCRHTAFSRQPKIPLAAWE